MLQVTDLRAVVGLFRCQIWQAGGKCVEDRKASQAWIQYQICGLISLKFVFAKTSTTIIQPGRISRSLHQQVTLWSVTEHN